MGQVPDMPSLEMAVRSLKVEPIIAPVHSDVEIETAMSAIDFDLGMERHPHLKGERVKITMSGKFLPYKYYGNSGNVPEYGHKERVGSAAFLYAALATCGVFSIWLSMARSRIGRTGLWSR